MDDENTPAQNGKHVISVQAIRLANISIILNSLSDLYATASRELDGMTADEQTLYLLKLKAELTHTIESLERLNNETPTN